MTTQDQVTCHDTYVHGSEREGWWWGCATCPTPVPANQFVFRRDAESEAAGHRRTANTETKIATKES